MSPGRSAGTVLKPLLVLHGGAGLDPARDYAVERGDLTRIAAVGRDLLLAGEPAASVVVQVVRELEFSGIYVAGRGASPNAAGEFELDAAVMDGSNGRSGAVAALVGFCSPVAVAEAVMLRTPHTLLAGAGAAAFARKLRFQRITQPHAWFRPAGKDEVIKPAGDHGTVGCVALDKSGRLACASSTGGTFGKLPGRVGDTPLIGAGLWADRRVAIACTGLGEYFQRTAAAVRLAHKMAFAGDQLGAAASDVLERVADAGGAGALIALNASGEVVVAQLGAGLKCAIARGDGEIRDVILPTPADLESPRRRPEVHTL